MLFLCSARLVSKMPDHLTAAFFPLLVPSNFIEIIFLFSRILLTTLVSTMFALGIETIVKTVKIGVNIWKSSFESQLYSSWMEQFLFDPNGFSKCWKILALKWCLTSNALWKVVLRSCFIPKIFDRGLEITGDHAGTLSQKYSHSIQDYFCQGPKCSNLSLLWGNWCLIQWESLSCS